MVSSNIKNSHFPHYQMITLIRRIDNCFEDILIVENVGEALELVRKDPFQVLKLLILGHLQVVSQ